MGNTFVWVRVLDCEFEPVGSTVDKNAYVQKCLGIKQIRNIDIVLDQLNNPWIRYSILPRTYTRGSLHS